MPMDWSVYAGGAQAPAPRNAIAAGLSSGVDDLKSLGYSAAAAVADTVGATTARDALNEKADAAQYMAGKNGRPDLERVEDVAGDPGKWLPYLGYQVAKQIPNIAGAIGTGLLVPEAAVPAALSRGAAVLPRALGGGGMGARVAEAAATGGSEFAARRAALEAGQTFGKQVMGGAAFNYGQGVGSLYQESVDGGDPNAGPVSLLGGVPYAVTETLPEAMLVGRVGHGSGFSGGLGKRMAKAGATQGAAGATSELLQNEMEMAYNGQVSDGNAFSRRLNSGVAGGLVEGVLGLPGGIRGKRAAQAPVNDAPGESTDLLNTPPLQLTHNGYFQQGQGQTPFVTFPDGSTATSSDAALAHANGMSMDDLAALRGSGPRVDTRLDSGVAPRATPIEGGRIVVDPAGTATTDAASANALYGKDNGDPGLVEARRRYVEGTLGQTDEQRAAAQAQRDAEIEREMKAQAIAQAAQEFTRRRDAAHTDLVENDPATGKPAVQLSQQDILLHHTLNQLLDAGVISKPQFAAYAGEVREALKSNDRKAINAVRKDVQAVASAAAAARAQAGAQTNAQASTPVQSKPVEQAPAQPAGQAAAGQPAGTGTTATAQAAGVKPASPATTVAAPAAPNVNGGLAAAEALHKKLQTKSANVNAVLAALPAEVRSDIQARAARLAHEGVEVEGKGTLARSKAILVKAAEEMVAAQREQVLQHAEKLMGRKLDPAEQAVVLRLGALNARDQAIVRDALGWDAENHQVNEPLSYEQIGEKYKNQTGKGVGQPMSRQSVQAVLSKVGLDEAKLDLLRATDTQSVSEEDLGLRHDGEASGFRISDKAMAGADDIEVDKKTARQDAEGKAAVDAAGKEAVDAVDAAIAARKAEADAQMEAKRKAAADADRAQTQAALEAKAAQAPRTLRDLLPADMHNDIEDAKADWEEDLLPGSPRFDELGLHRQAAWVRAYASRMDGKINAQTYARRQEEIIDEQRAAAPEAGDGVAPGAEGTQGSGGQGAGHVTARLQEGADRAAQAAPPADQGHAGSVAPDDWGQSGQQSKAGRAQGSTVESITADLAGLMPVNRARVKIVQATSDIPAAVRRSVGVTADTQAFVLDGKAYLIASQIAPGKARSVFLHEVGAHLGMENLLGEEHYDALVDKITAWAERTDDSLEHRLAVRALERVHSAQVEDAQANSELVAYFVEEAVDAGVDPTALKHNSDLARWLSQMFAAMKRALAKLGLVDAKGLTAQDIVDLAYGAAKIEMEQGAGPGGAQQSRKMGDLSSLSAERIGQMLDQVREQYAKSDMPLDEMHSRVDALVQAQIAAQKREDASTKVDGLTEVFPGFKVIPTGTRVRASHGLSVKDTMGTVVGQKVQRVGKEMYSYPVVQFDAKEGQHVNFADQPRALLPWNIHEVYAPRAAKAQFSKQAGASWRDRIQGERTMPDGRTMYLVGKFGPIKNAGMIQWQAHDGSQMLSVYDTDLINSGVRPARAQVETFEMTGQGPNGDWSTAGVHTYGVGQGASAAVSKYRAQLTEVKAAKIGRDPYLKFPAGSFSTAEIRDAFRVLRDMAMRGGQFDAVQRVAIYRGTGATAGQAPRYITRDQAVKFSKASAARDQLAKSVPAPARSAWTNVSDFFAKHAPWFLTSFQIAQQWGDRIGTLPQMIALQDAMKKQRVTMSERVHAVAVKADKLPAAVKAQLNQVMQAATMQEMHPDLPFDHKDNAHLKSEDVAKAAKAAKARDAHAALQRQYNALPADAKAAYQAVKGELEAQWKERTAAMKALVDDTFSERIRQALEAGDHETVARLTAEGTKYQADVDKQLSRIKGPYFPLLRFGEYLAIGESKEFLAAKDELASAEGARRKEMQAKVDAMKRDAKHYEVSAHDTRAEQISAVAALKQRGLQARADMADLKRSGMRAVSNDTLEHLTSAISDQFDAKTAAAVNAALESVFLRSLPETAALGREAERKGVAGASVDMLRAFAATGEQNAFHTSRLLYAKKLADTLFAMKKEVKGDIDLQHVHREMEQRMALDMTYKPTPVQDALNSVSWAYHLGISPSFMFINSTQPYLVTGPVLAGRFGLGRATKALGQAARDSMAVLKAARWENGKFDAWSGISEDTIPTTGRTAEGVAEDRKAIRALMQRGILDEGAQHELNMFSQDSSRTLAKVNRWMGWTTQQIEMVNRMTTALASFRLAREGGMDYDKALQYAYETTLETQMDYSGEGTARFMREGGGIPLAKLIFQFRRYQQSMLYLLGDNIRKAAAGGQEAKDARATLGYFAITSALSAGVMGMPFAGAALALAGMFDDPDDERGDVKTRLRNWLFDLTGDRGTADVLAKGLPAMFGVDLSQRIGLGDVASPFPMARIDGKTGADRVGQSLTAIGGPSAGLAAQAFDAVLRFEAGDWAKGVEKLMPKAVADVLRAARYATEGMTDTRGEQILGPEEIGAWNTFTRAMGVSSTQEANYYEGTQAKKGVETAVGDRKTRIQREYTKALQGGDMAAVRKEIVAFNQDHPTHQIKAKDELEWRKAHQKSQAQRDGTGIRLDPKRDKGYTEVMRFAR